MPTDIDTTTIADAPEITDLGGLTQTIHELAQTTLTVREAEAKMAKAIEKAKADCEAATSPYKTRIERLFTAVARYAEAAIDSLFPRKKNGARQKKYRVLQHDLLLRSSSSITAPDDIIARLNAWLADRRYEAVAAYRRGDPPAHITCLEGEAGKIATLIRQPPPELDKERASALLKDTDCAPILAALGIAETTEETFKVAFNFTPLQS